VHFGYTDGISQPTVIGDPETPPADHQQPWEPWLFVLLDEALSYYVPDPPELGRTGSFVAFRVLRQDVVGLRSSSSRTRT
jgi:deferrochelatase/peroxidase EfeB